MIHHYTFEYQFHRYVDLHWLILIIGICTSGHVIYGIPQGCPACPSDVDFSAYNISSEQSIDNETQKITLYRSGQDLTWCEAHCACKHVDSTSYLLTIPNALKQQEIERFNSSDISQQAWISSNRRSGGWYWISKIFENCSQPECSGLNIVDGEYGTGKNDSTEPTNLRAQKIVSNGISGLCANGEAPSPDITWYEKQLRCISKTSLLATWDDLLRHNGLNYFYLGLQYRPWQWTRDGDTFPVLFTNWIPGDRQNAEVADCLSVELNSTSQGKWVELNCAVTLHHFICENKQYVSTTADPDSSTESTRPEYNSTGGTPQCRDCKDILKYWLPPVLIVAVAAIIIPITVVKCKQKQKKMETGKDLGQETRDKPDDPDEGGEVLDPDTAVVIPGNNQLGFNAYPLEASQYAEIGSIPSGQEKPARHGQTVKQQNLYSTASDINPYSISATTNTYPDRTSIPNQSVPGNQTIYSQVTRPEENDTVLVDNQQYSSFGVVHGGKNSVPSEPLVDMNGAITVQVGSDNPDQTSFSIPRPQLKSEP